MFIPSGSGAQVPVSRYLGIDYITLSKDNYLRSKTTNLINNTRESTVIMIAKIRGNTSNNIPLLNVGDDYSFFIKNDNSIYLDANPLAVSPPYSSSGNAVLDKWVIMVAKFVYFTVNSRYALRINFHNKDGSIILAYEQFINNDIINAKPTQFLSFVEIGRAQNTTEGDYEIDIAEIYYANRYMSAATTTNTIKYLGEKYSHIL